MADLSATLQNQLRAQSMGSNQHKVDHQVQNLGGKESLPGFASRPLLDTTGIPHDAQTQNGVQSEQMAWDNLESMQGGRWVATPPEDPAAPIDLSFTYNFEKHDDSRPETKSSLVGDRIDTIPWSGVNQSATRLDKEDLSPGSSVPWPASMRFRDAGFLPGVARVNDKQEAMYPVVSLRSTVNVTDEYGFGSAEDPFGLMWST